MRRYLLLAVFGLVGVASADPVPEPKGEERLKWLYGEPVGVPRDCSVELTADDRLQMRLPKAAGTGFDTPVVKFRTIRPVTGDFVATVRILDQSKASPPTGGYEKLSTAAGLIVGDTTWTGVVFALARTPGHPTLKRAATYWVADRGGGTQYFEDTPRESTWLRLTRRGGVWTFERSADGSDWTETAFPVTKPELLLGKTTIGLFAVNSGDAPYFVEFDKFSVTRPAAAKK